MAKGKTGRLWYLGIIGVIVIVFVALLESRQPGSRFIDWMVRTAALLGYFCVFAAIVSSATMRQMIQIFGTSFIKVHHILSITGLVLITIHPLAVAWDALSLAVFIPRVDSWSSFFAYGGRVAWYLLGIGSLAAALRKPIGKNWRLLHTLNYIAFWLATVHGVLIGANVQDLAMRIVFGAMALVVLGVLVQKRLAARRRKK